MTRGNYLGSVAAAAALALAIGCGSSSPTAPSGGTTGGSGGTSGGSGATITIGSNGAISPTSVTVAVGQSVTFVNNDSQTHDMESNPHPTHTDCPAINAVGLLAAGQTRQTQAFTTARSCGFHDHQQPTNASLQGTIVIQ